MATFKLRANGSADGLGIDEHYYLQHANFNVTAVTDNAGAVVERYAYTPYGEVAILDADFSLDGTSDISNEFLYTGRRLDPETGLQLNRNRFYASHLGRWVTRDPIGYLGGMENLYEYVGSMPTYYEDPFGLAWWNPYDSTKDGPWEWFFGPKGPPPAPPAVAPVIPVVGPALPPGVGEAVGALECVPDLIRIGDMTKKRRKLMEDVMDDDAFDENEDSKKRHRPRIGK